MGEFLSRLQERMREAASFSADARASGDDFSAAVYEGDLEELRRIAREHEIDLRDSAPVLATGAA